MTDPIFTSQKNSVFQRSCGGKILKILQEKEKMLMTSISSFSYKAFFTMRDSSYNFRHILSSMRRPVNKGQD